MYNINEETARILDTITPEQWQAINTITPEQWFAIHAISAEWADGKVMPMQFQPDRAENIKLNEKQLYRKVTEFIREIGVPANVAGYKYLRYAIILAYNNNEYVEAITKCLYPDVAKEFETTSPRVERAIRHAIEAAWIRADIEELTKIFNWRLDKGKPTNSEFIAAAAEYLKNS